MFITKTEIDEKAAGYIMEIKYSPVLPRA